MPVVKTSARALSLALLPAALIQAVLLVLSARFWFDETTLGLRGPDGVLTLFAVQMAIFGGLLFAGHLALRHFAIYGRSAYGTMGAVAAVAAYVMAARYGILSNTPMQGTWISSAILPTIAGALSGFLYGQFAGVETVAAPPTGDEAEAAPPAGALRGRFEGPVRVRSSLGATALATFLPALLVGMLSFTILQSTLVGVPHGYLVGLAAQAFLMSMFLTALPALVLILATHHTARALGYMRGLHYGAIGAGYGALFALLLGPFAGFPPMLLLAMPSLMTAGLVIPSALAGALMGALYRRFAGLEPVPLPEAVIVTDVETLVPADDPARRGHSILLNG